MVPKKNPKADLENKRTLFFQIGLIIALGGAMAAFEWSSHETTTNILADNSTTLPSEELPPLVRIKEKLPELPKIKSVEFLNIVKDLNENLDDQLDLSTEDVGQDVDLTPNVTLNGEGDDDTPLPFVVLETKPEFPGGMDALMRYVAGQVRYPVICAEAGIQGTVYIAFVIDKTGKVTDVSLSRGVHTALDNEALRVISGMPDWKPGKQREKPVRVSFTIPVRFALQ